MESNGVKFQDTEYVMLLGEFKKLISPNRPLFKSSLFVERGLNFVKWLRDNPDIPVQPVTLNSSRKFYVDDGYHRIAVFSKMGVEQIGVRFNSEESRDFFLKKGIVKKA